VQLRLANYTAILWSPVVGERAMHHVIIALVAVVVVAFTWIVLEAKERRRQSPAISQAVTRPPKDRLTRP
jgi:hypothetical protein